MGHFQAVNAATGEESTLSTKGRPQLFYMSPAGCSLIFVVAAAVVLLAAPAPSQAQFFTGDGLWRMCGRTTSGRPPEACNGFVAGVVDGRKAGGQAEPYCIAKRAPLPQLTEVVRSYLKDRPELHARPAGQLVVEALMVAFPCSSPDEHPGR